MERNHVQMIRYVNRIMLKVKGQLSMKPIIGVTPSIDSNTGQHFINKDNMDVLVQAGANPVILPYKHNVAIIEQM